MDVTTQLVLDWLASYLWPFFRISAMFMTMTGLSSKNVPARIRLLAALATTVAVAPAIPSVPSVELVSIPAFLIGAQQILIGVAIGFVSMLVMQTFVLAGHVVGMQTSLGFANMVDPSNGQQVPVVGQFYLMLATLLFFVMDGHLVMIRMVAESFNTIPIGFEGIAIDSWRSIAEWLAWVYAGGLAMAISALIALLLVNFAFGVATRAAPQLNIFSIGFPVTMLTGLLIIWLTLDSFLMHYEIQWQRGLQLMCEVIQLDCS